MTIPVRQEQVDRLYAKVFPDDGPRAAGGPRLAARKDLSETDAELVARARRAKHGDKFGRLWDGNTADYGGDHSRADAGMVRFLLWWTGGNEGWADALFRQCGLYRPKWDERRGAQTYGRRTMRRVKEKMAGFRRQPIPFVWPTFHPTGNGHTATGPAADSWGDAREEPLPDDPGGGPPPGCEPPRDDADAGAAGHRGAAEAPADRMGSGFPRPIPASRLQGVDRSARWLWDGYLVYDGITLMSALWKAGKTTLLAHSLKALQDGADFCGRPVRKAAVLYVTEESQSVWADRRDRLGLTDATEFVVRPFLGKPDRARWAEFLTGYLPELLAARPADLVVFDTLGNLWPVKDENDAAQVQEALMPLRLISEGRSLLLVHHLRKSDGAEGTASRGSGALPGFVDVLVELRRVNPNDRADRQRVLSAWGRYDETPAELVVELTEAGYVARGDREAAASAAIVTRLLRTMPADPPGWTAIALLDAWNDDQKPRRQTFYHVLGNGVERGLWHREGTGKKGDPHTFWRAK